MLWKQLSSNILPAKIMLGGSIFLSEVVSNECWKLVIRSFSHASKVVIRWRAIGGMNEDFDSARNFEEIVKIGAF